MARLPKPYTRLPGRGLRRSVFAVSATRCSLWFGADHLLAVDSTVATEEYRRFYFRDIEAFVLRRTRRGRVFTSIFLLLALLTAGPLLVVWRMQDSVASGVTAAFLAAFWGGLGLVNILRGPTVETKVRTAVQFEQLPSLGRLPVARKVLDRLAPLIAAAQGVLTPEESSAASWTRPAPDSRAARPLRHEKGTSHYAVFLLLLVDAVLTALAFGFFSTAFPHLMTASMLTTLVGFLLCIFAVMRQSETDLPRGARMITIGALVFYILSFGTGFVFTVISAAKHAESARSNASVQTGTGLNVQFQTGAEIIYEPGFATAATIAAGFSAVLGLAGLIAMRAPRTARPAA